MARTLTTAAKAAALAGLVRPAVFYEGWFNAAGSPSPAALRLWTGHGSFTWDGKTWLGAGNMLSVSPIEESSDIRASGIQIGLSGASTSLLSLNLGSARQGLPGRVWLGFFDAAGALIADPYLAFAGRFDVPEILDDEATARISASYESRLVDLDRVRERRYTPEDHKLDYPTDLGFDQVPVLQDAPIFWGTNRGLDRFKGNAGGTVGAGGNSGGENGAGIGYGDFGYGDPSGGDGFG